jgi:hypothetical protein
MDPADALAGRRATGRPRRAAALIFAAKIADIWLHPIALIRGRRRRPMTFEDLAALGLLDAQPRGAGVASGGNDGEVPGAQEVRVPVVH